MQTSLVNGFADPPPTTTQIVGQKRLREKVQLVGGVANFPLATPLSCLPLLAPEIRVLKVSVWASAAANSLLTVVFNPSNAGGGDAATFVDEGIQGSARPAVHLIPSFLYRSVWWNASGAVGVSLLTLGGTATDLLVVDVTVEYRTAVQACPAYMAVMSRAAALALHESDSEEEVGAKEWH